MSCLLCAFALLGGLGWQEPQDTAGDDVRSWLRHLDGRIYVPPELSALAFGFRPKYPAADGKTAREAPYVVRYRWRNGTGDRVDLLGHEQKVIARLPGFSDEQHAKAVQDFLLVARNLAGIVRGMTLSRQYADWRGRVVKRTVNNQEEVSLVLEPRTVKRVRRVTMHLRRDGIPWKTDKVYASGDRFTQHHTYEKRPEGLILTKLQRIHTPADPRQPAFDSAFILTWQRSGGILLPATIRKLGKKLPPQAKGTTAFRNLKVNEDVGEFEPMRAAKR